MKLCVIRDKETTFDPEAPAALCTHGAQRQTVSERPGDGLHLFLVCRWTLSMVWSRRRQEEACDNVQEQMLVDRRLTRFYCLQEEKYEVLGRRVIV